MLASALYQGARGTTWKITLTEMVLFRSRPGRRNLSKLNICWLAVFGIQWNFRFGFLWNLYFASGLTHAHTQTVIQITCQFLGCHFPETTSPVSFSCLLMLWKRFVEPGGTPFSIISPLRILMGCGVPLVVMFAPWVSIPYLQKMNAVCACPVWAVLDAASCSHLGSKEIGGKS